MIFHYGTQSKKISFQFRVDLRVHVKVHRCGVDASATTAATATSHISGSDRGQRHQIWKWSWRRAFAGRVVFQSHFEICGETVGSNGHELIPSSETMVAAKPASDSGKDSV
jgi:hypothetical protein